MVKKYHQKASIKIPIQVSKNRYQHFEGGLKSEQTVATSKYDRFGKQRNG